MKSDLPMDSQSIDFMTRKVTIIQAIQYQYVNYNNNLTAGYIFQF